MELKEFIQNAITDITTAINKSSQNMIDAKIGNGIPDAKEINITFDIAVTVSSNDTTEGGAKINVLGPYLSLGGNKKNTKDIEQVSRLTFIVPIRIKTLGQSQYSIT
jgi:hypothetical protein